jgi:hypothetical protein
MKRLWTGILALGLCASGPALGQQQLGRLFFTPEQRDALDARRKARLPDKPAAPVVASPTTRLDGYVMRSGGKSTVWVNSEPVPEGTQPEGLRVQPARGDPARAAVVVGESETRIELKVGETLDRGSGEVSDVIGGGEVRVRRPTK